MTLKDHWNNVYETKPAHDVSWFQASPEISLKLITATGVRKGQGIIDVGAGASLLVDCLLEQGFHDLSALDISLAGLRQAHDRLGERAKEVEWIEADVTDFHPGRQYDLWHDRAVFHFLTEKGDREKYRQTLLRALKPQAHLIIATFALDGPQKCSGLEVARYDSAKIQQELSAEFQLVQVMDEVHKTPWDTHQKFQYFRFVCTSRI